MIRRKQLKKIIVLFFITIMLFSATMVLASSKNITTSYELNTQPSELQIVHRDMIWDNGLHTTNLLASQVDDSYPFNAQIADDFQFEKGYTITEIIVWGGFWMGNPVNPIDVNIIFYADDGSGTMPTGAGMDDPTPTALLVDFHTAVFGINNGDSTYTYDIVLNTPFMANAGEKYWVACQWVGTYPPEWGWCVSDSQHLHNCMQGFPLLGTEYWTDSGIGDVAFQLIGNLFIDTTPPVTTCNITGTNPVTIILTATDDYSGVNSTLYKIDEGAYTIYTKPIQITEPGDHIIYYSSVDNEGNEESEKSKSFTVEEPTITIIIKGGLGVSVAIKNTGSTDLAGIDWSINLNGNLIFGGKAKSGTIDALVVGEQKTFKDFVVGFGKIDITVYAGLNNATASGRVLLVFVMGVA